MLTRDQQLARLRVALDTGFLPRDLGAWILAELAAPSERAAARAAALERAAQATGEAARKTRAKALAGIVASFREYPGLLAVAWYPEGSAESIVQQLMRTGVMPASWKQIWRRIR